MSGVPEWYWRSLAFVGGIVVGSFLNVVIWRLPRRESLVSPGSHCPHCNRALSGIENVPLLSFLVLRARCRTCHTPITWRYFFVELVTGLLFLAVYWYAPSVADGVAGCLFVAGLVAATVIDAEHFIIPDGLNAWLFAVGVGRDIYGICVADPAHALVWGWVPRSLLGGGVCAAAFVGIQLFGLALFRRDSMGDGDVKLARGIGSLLPMSVAFGSFFLAVAAGAVYGIGRALICRPGKPMAASVGEGPEAAPATMRDTVRYGLAYVFGVDLIVGGLAAVGVAAARRASSAMCGELGDLEDDEFTATPAHLPFGPFMAVGALAAMFVGQQLIDLYVGWAFPSVLPR